MVVKKSCYLVYSLLIVLIITSYLTLFSSLGAKQCLCTWWTVTIAEKIKYNNINEINENNMITL